MFICILPKGWRARTRRWSAWMASMPSPGRTWGTNKGGQQLPLDRVRT